MPLIRDIAGMRFGHLTALAFSHLDNSRRAVWSARCDCGREVSLRANAMQSGNTKSCGCRGRNFTPRDTPLIERLLSNITAEPNSGCWLWMHSHNAKLYGTVRTGDGKQLYVHRAVYEHFVGPIPKDLVIDHICRVTLCCNPKHLRPLGRYENWALGDPWARWRNRTHCAKGHPLTPENTRPKGSIGNRCKHCYTAFRKIENARYKAKVREKKALATASTSSQSPD